MKLIDAYCPICNRKNDFIVLYKANFQPIDFNIHTFSARRLPDRIHYQIVKCKNDGLVRSNPVLDNSNLDKLYKKSKLGYENEVEYLTQTYLNNLLPVLKKIPYNAKILEIGCGSGFVLEKLHQMGYRNLYGIEPSLDAVKKAKKKLKNFIINDVFKPRLYKPNMFDFIFFIQTLDHISKPNQFLQECYRLLKPKGLILAFNHNIDSFSYKILKEKSPIVDIEHTYLFSFNTMKAIFAKNNFKVLSIYSPFNIISLKYLFYLFPLPKIIKNYILGLNNQLINSLLKRSISIKLGNVCLVARKNI